MSVSSEKRTSRVAVEVSSDRMEARISVSMGEGDRPPDPEEVQAASEDVQVEPEDVQALIEEVRVVLEEKGILITGYVAERIEELGILMEDNNEHAARFPIAKGQLPVDGIDGEFTWHESIERLKQDWRGDAAIDYRVLNSMVTVEPDKPIGTISRATPGVDGFDVYGSTLKPEHAAREVRLDQSVRLADDDSLTVFSNVAGKVVYTNLTLAIEEVIVIEGDVDFESGHRSRSVRREVREVDRRGRCDRGGRRQGEG